METKNGQKKEQESGFICHKVVLEQGGIPVIPIIPQQMAPAS